ncbi:hypothetical protein [Alkalihalobacterium elongatum]|uniref:hypothetical protein n=1 Tax=Alkalihalobacterium elongatum TaxID=2675466 RepID=UPI001C1FDAB7|nr:hypothetical protein [Alkalihalobacterium elongatum]
MKKISFVLGSFLLSSTVLIGCATLSQSTPDGPVFYVANAGDGTISIVDVNKSDTERIIDIGYEQLSHGIAVSPDEK